jgi:hypothetical protein
MSFISMIQYLIKVKKNEAVVFWGNILPDLCKGTVTENSTSVFSITLTE